MKHETRALVRHLYFVERVPLVAHATEDNRGYLDVKRDKLGHLFAH